jgi:hypothetical protein
LFPPDVEVPEEDPFAHDRLSRKGEAEQLTTLLEHSPTPFVLGLDAAWGTGKTTFVKMWRQHLENEDYKTIYFNAWETDFISEPLVALVGEVGCLLTPKSKDIAKKLTSATGLLLKKATPIAIRLLTAGLIDIKAEDLRALDPGELEKALSETAEKVVEGAIEQYQRHKDEVGEFRKALRQAVEAASAGGKPLVFFVDELDRCRPTFAVELLERIKHLFEVQGVVFVLSVHREQLAHSLRAIYGHDFDAEGYLGRFFHLGYRLADPPPGEYTKFLVNQVGFSDGHPDAECLAFLMGYLGFSLRQQQRCITRFALVRRIIGRGNQYDNPAVYAALLTVREWQPKLYEPFLVGQSTADDLLRALVAVNRSRWESTREAANIEIGLLGLELDRQRAMRREMRTAPLWKSSLLELYSAQAEKGDERSKLIVEDLERHEKSYMFPREGQWRRVLKLLELGGQIQIQGTKLG